MWKHTVLVEVFHDSGEVLLGFLVEIWYCDTCREDSVVRVLRSKIGCRLGGKVLSHVNGWTRQHIIDTDIEFDGCDTLVYTCDDFFGNPVEWLITRQSDKTFN